MTLLGFCPFSDFFSFIYLPGGVSCFGVKVRSSFFSCGPSPLFPIHLPHIALLHWRLVAAFFSFVLSACCHCFSCLHVLFRFLFVSFFRLSAHYSVCTSSYLPRFFFLGFYLFMWIFLRDILFPRAWSVLLSCGQLLFCFNLACCLPDSLLSCFSWSLFFWLRLYLVPLRLFSLSRPSSLSLRLLSSWLRLLFVSPWRFSSTPLLLHPLFSSMRFTVRYRCCAYRSPLLVASCLLL